MENLIGKMEDMWKNVGEIMGKVFDVEKIGNVMKHTYIIKRKKDE